MRYHFFLLLLISSSLIAQSTYFTTNKSHMILDKIEKVDIGEYYVIKDENINEWSYTYTYYENSIIVKEQVEYYTDNFLELIKISNLEDGIETNESYKHDLLLKVEEYNGPKLITVKKYYYNNSRELIKVEKFNGNEELIYTDSYFRNKDGSLRKLERDNSNGFYNHWFYKSGVIIESWLIEGELSSRTKYNNNGRILSIILYKNDQVLSNEDFKYRENGTILLSKKISGSSVDEKRYNSDGNLEEIRLLNNDILIQKTTYKYIDSYIVQEIITGHGKREEFFYERNDLDEIISVNYYLNGQLKRIKLIDSDDSEIFEYYRDDIIYLKEYFFQGERVRRDLYLEGKLFKSESINE